MLTDRARHNLHMHRRVPVTDRLNARLDPFEPCLLDRCMHRGNVGPEMHIVGVNLDAARLEDTEHLLVERQALFRRDVFDNGYAESQIKMVVRQINTRP